MCLRIFSILIFFSCLTTYGGYFPSLNITVNTRPEPGYLFLAADEVHPSISNNYGFCIDSSRLSRYTSAYDFTIQRNNVLTFFSIDAEKYYSINSSFDITDSFSVSSDFHTDFHDLAIFSDGSYMIIGEKLRSVDMSLILPGGNENATVVDCIFQYYNKNKQLQFTWNSKDHIAITDAVADVDLYSNFIRYIHLNSLERDSDGHYLLSCRNLNEIIKVNKTTGAIIWRMGGSASKNNQFQFLNDTKDNFTGFSHIHDVKKLSNGNILVFDNGNLRQTPFSRVVEYTINESSKIVSKKWEFVPNPIVYAPFMGSAQRLPNGNTLSSYINRIIEVDKNGTIVFDANTNDPQYRVNKFVYKMAGVVKNITSTKSATLDFNNMANTTGVAMQMNQFASTGRLMLSKHNHFPDRYGFKGPLPQKVLPVRWVLTSEIAGGVGRITFDTKTISGFDLADSLEIFYREKEDGEFFERLATTYNESTQKLEIDYVNGGEFILASSFQLSKQKPTLLDPRDKVVLNSISPVLSWYPMNGVSSYEIQISKQEDFGEVAYTASNLTATTFSLSNLDYAETYFWRVRGKANQIVSDWSDQWSFVINVKQPQLVYPGNQSRNIITNTNLSWTESKSADYYEMQFGLDSTFNDLIHYKTDLLTPEFNLKELENRKEYYWRVRASFKGMFTDWTKAFRFTTELTVPVVTYPGNGKKGVSASPELKYTGPKEADLYQVLISKEPDFKNTQQITFIKNNLPNLKLDLYTEYYIKLRSIAQADTSRWSEVNKFKTVITSPKLIFPTNFYLLAPVPTYFYFEPVTGGLYYDINIKSFDENKVLKADTIFQVTAANIVVDFLNKRTLNYWRVKTHDADGESDWSSTNEFGVNEEGLINSPALISPENKAQAIGLNGYLVWKSTGASIDRYRVMLAGNESFDNVLIDEMVEQNTKLYYKGLNNNKNYYWRVAAPKDGAYSDWSSPYSFTTKELTFFQTPNLINPENNTIVDVTSLDLIWEKISGASSYKVQFATDANFTTIINEDQNYPGYNYRVNGLKEKTDYYWRVKAKDAGGQETEWSEVFTFKTVDIFTSVEAEEGVSVSFTKESQFVLYDISGKKIETLQSSYNNIDELKTELPGGVYFLKIITDKQKIIRFEVIR